MLLELRGRERHQLGMHIEGVVRWRRLTDRASAAATAQLSHYPTFIRTEAAASCMRLLGRGGGGASRGELARVISSWGAGPIGVHNG